MSPLVSICHNGLKIATPLLLGAVGGLFTELAGMLNIALEGLMLISAFTSVLVAGLSGSLVLGRVAGVTASLLLASVFAFASLRLRANVFIAGIATNLLAAGLVAVIATQLFGHRGVHRFSHFPALPYLPAADGGGFFSQVFLNQPFSVYGGWIVLLLAALTISHTPFGLRLSAVGQDRRTAQSLGLEPTFYRAAAILVSGFTCGLAGSTLSLSLGAYVPQVIAGRGWIALVIIYLGGRRPAGIFAASLLFGLAESLSNYSQGVFKGTPDIILAFPYLIALLALILSSAWNHYRSLRKG